MILKFNVKEQTISLVNTKSVPRIGSKDYLVLQFSFSSDWESLDKLVYLQSGDVSQPINIVDNLVEVPEWFTEQTEFNVTLFGKSADDSVEVPTNVITVFLKESNNLWEKDAPEPQNSWVVQVIDARDEALAAAIRAENAAIHQPYPNAETGTWWVWNAETGKYEDTGEPSRGETGQQGPKGDAGPQGERGPAGADGAAGPQGPKGDAFTYADFTEAQLLALKGPKGDKGDTGDTGPQGPQGEQGPAGVVDISLGVTGATVGQIAKITAVDDTGKPTAWEAVDMPSGGSGGHWETVLDTVWEQDVIHPTAFDSVTGVFTCAEGELANLALDTEYVFFQQCAKEGAAYNTIINADNVKVTKLSDTTFSIDSTPPTAFVPANVKFSKGACLAITDIDARKIRLTLDGQFGATATKYNTPFFGAGKPYFAENASYISIRNAYQAYQQITAEVESPYRIVGKILCGFNAPSGTASFHFKNNSFCCPLIPRDVPEGNERTYFLTSDGTKIDKLYSTPIPWNSGAYAISNDYLKIISGTRVMLERWVE